LILVLAGDLFQDEADLALAHSLAVVLRSYANRQPDWRLPQFTEELSSIARNQRKFLGMDDAARAFNPDEHKGKVAITTMHNAKGLEWDRVYLMSVNSYDFPSGLPGETYYDEKYFAREGLNLRAEALAQLEASTDPFNFDYVEGGATGRARQEYIGERLRLLYVGITRARKELIVTFNSGRARSAQAAEPFIELRRFAQTELKSVSDTDE
jgi:DNA helicase II / ATP-dependent DNA helicase PcrA